MYVQRWLTSTYFLVSEVKLWKIYVYFMHCQATSSTCTVNMICFSGCVCMYVEEPVRRVQVLPTVSRKRTSYYCSSFRRHHWTRISHVRMKDVHNFVLVLKRKIHVCFKLICTIIVFKTCMFMLLYTYVWHSVLWLFCILLLQLHGSRYCPALCPWGSKETKW